MYILKNDELDIQIIDPDKDRELLGSRYCTGGYVFQVKDLNKGNLFSGPTFPDDFNVFDGQGAPEVFVTALNEQCEVGNDVYVLGVGLVTRTSPMSPFQVRDNPKVKKPCSWIIEEKPESIRMTSKCVFNQWNFDITKIITLNYRTVSSQTKIKNNGDINVPILWFAHPFFPFPKNWVSSKFSQQISLAENQGYFINNKGFIELKKEYHWKKGLYQKVVSNYNEKLSVHQPHPIVGKVAINCDFIPESIAIWANDITFSFEPFYKENIESCKEKAWGITYCF